MKDLERISKKVEIDVDESDPDWLDAALTRIKELTLRMMGVILPFLSDSQVAGLYDWIYEILMKFFNVTPDRSDMNLTTGENLIYLLATKFNLEVTIKRL